MKLTLLFGLAWTLLCSCVSSPGPDARLPLYPSEDSAYWPHYETASRQIEVVKNFETRHQIVASYLTPDFRAAIAERYRSIFNDQKPVFEAATDSTGFFVSVYSANRNLEDLSNSELWNITLQVKEGTLRPTRIQRLVPKELWSAFFPTISPWSQEYLILFKLPVMAPESGSPQGLTLNLSAPDGSAHASW